MCISTAVAVCDACVGFLCTATLDKPRQYRKRHPPRCTGPPGQTDLYLASWQGRIDCGCGAIVVVLIRQPSFQCKPRSTHTLNSTPFLTVVHIFTTSISLTVPSPLYHLYHPPSRVYSTHPSTAAMSLRDKACPFLTLVQSETNPAIVEFREGTTISYKGDVRYGRVREPRDGEVYSSVLYGEYTEGSMSHGGVVGLVHVLEGGGDTHGNQRLNTGDAPLLHAHRHRSRPTSAPPEPNGMRALCTGYLCSPKSRSRFHTCVCLASDS